MPIEYPIRELLLHAVRADGPVERLVHRVHLDAGADRGQRRVHGFGDHLRGLGELRCGGSPSITVRASGAW